MRFFIKMEVWEKGGVFSMPDYFTALIVKLIY